VTVDERLDRLTERHEALMQSAELLLRESQEHTRQTGACAKLPPPCFRSPNITNAASPAWKKAINNPESLAHMAGATN
jgi:hypothetical protein